MSTNLTYKLAQQTIKVTPVNAISPTHLETAEQRTARHMSMCAELASLGMDLARAAAARCRAGDADPEALQPPTEASARRPAAGKPTDPAIIFIRVTASVRDCIALEAKLAAGLAATTRAAAGPRSADPRRPTLLDAFRHVTKNHPDRAALIRETTLLLDEQLAADPDQAIEVPELLWTICNELNIDIDLATLPDEYLGMADEADPRAAYPP